MSISFIDITNQRILIKYILIVYIPKLSAYINANSQLIAPFVCWHAQSLMIGSDHNNRFKQELFYKCLEWLRVIHSNCMCTVCYCCLIYGRLIICHDICSLIWLIIFAWPLVCLGSLFRMFMLVFCFLHLNISSLITCTCIFCKNNTGKGFQSNKNSLTSDHRRVLLSHF